MKLGIVKILFGLVFSIHTALFQPAFFISAQSEWCYLCYTRFYLRIVYDGHCKLSSQIGIGTGN
jgi:hypothetical protein